MRQPALVCAGVPTKGGAKKRESEEETKTRPLYSLTLQFPRPVPRAAPSPLPTPNTMSDNKSCTLRTRKMMKNPLLARRQMVRLASSEREKKGGGAAGDRVRADCRGARGRPPPRRHSRAPTLGGPRPVSDAPALAGIARRGRGAPGTRPQKTGDSPLSRRRRRRRRSPPSLLSLSLSSSTTQIVDVLHPGRPNVPKAEIQEKLQKVRVAGRAWGGRRERCTGRGGRSRLRRQRRRLCFFPLRRAHVPLSTPFPF